MRFLIAVAAAGLSLTPKATLAQSTQTACESLRTFSKAGSRILASDYRPAGPLQLRGTGSFTPPPIEVDAHCAVSISTITSTESAVTSEIWLPDPAAWNGKLLGTGNGGYSSALSYPQMAQALSRGYAVGGSDTGHQGDRLDFGAGHPERIRDWAYRSTHVLAEDEKALVSAFYRKHAAHSYFVGCSTGGQQALSEAQRYPKYFDGIVAGDPGNDRILLNADFVESWLTTHPANQPAFPAAKLALLSHAAMAACDKQDGLADGVISDPTRCTFDPATLACSTGPDTTTCLTGAEIDMARRLYDGPVQDHAGKPIYPGWPRGSEAGWGSYLVSPEKPVRLEFWTSWVFDSPSFDVRSFDAPTAIAAARAKLPYVEAVDPDLRPFRDSGGRLLLYHGWADPVVPPQDTINYYEKVKNILGPATESSVRLFMVSGMGHCGGGSGASTFDALGALDRWVTGLALPDSILATHNHGSEPAFERPLCPYPRVAQWDGKGDAAKSSSFHCQVLPAQRGHEQLADRQSLPAGCGGLPHAAAGIVDRAELLRLPSRDPGSKKRFGAAGKAALVVRTSSFLPELR